MTTAGNGLFPAGFVKVNGSVISSPIATGDQKKKRQQGWQKDEAEGPFRAWRASIRRCAGFQRRKMSDDASARFSQRDRCNSGISVISIGKPKHK